MKKIDVLYFAMLREQRGLSEESIDTAASTPAELYSELAGCHGFSIPRERLRVVINESFVPWESRLSEGDAVAFIPPVAGG